MCPLSLQLISYLPQDIFLDRNHRLCTGLQWIEFAKNQNKKEENQKLNFVTINIYENKILPDFHRQL